jgi:three-Cys-motif partner protein
LGYYRSEQMAKRENTQQTFFGGSWTQQKLDLLSKYLHAYVKIFTSNPKASFFKTHYVDAFAGSGYMQIDVPEMPLLQLFPGFNSEIHEQVDAYGKGSVVRALEIEPGFDHYLFIERKAGLAQELESLKNQFQQKAAAIEVRIGDANSVLTSWLQEIDWRKNRAVVFLDPFGMQVDWTTIEAIAKTSAIDLWLLFPVFGVNRMLVTSGEIQESWKTRLSRVFGTTEWEKKFYTEQDSILLDGVSVKTKVADPDLIGAFFIERLKSVFADVAPPKVLRNNHGQPLFLLCFAVGNARKAELALKIAKQILEG